MPKQWRQWGALWLLVGLFLASWIAQFLTQLRAYRHAADAQNEGIDWSNFMSQFFSSTFENWQSEFMQLAVQALVIGVFANTFFPAYVRAQQNNLKEAVRDVLAEER